MNTILGISTFMINELQLNKNIFDKLEYDYLISVETVNQAVLQGIPFRDLYKQVSNQIASGTFEPSKELKHIHVGSMGNLCNEDIKQKFEAVLELFPVEKVAKAKKDLIGETS